MNINKISLAYHIFSLIAVSVLLIAVASRHNNSIFGYSTNDLFSSTYEGETVTPPDKTILNELKIQDTNLTAKGNAKWRTSEGTTIYSSEGYVEKVYGYAGETPIYIAIKNDSVKGIAAGNNKETPNYMRLVINSKLLQKWDNLSIQNASNQEVDAVSGATFTSKSLIKNIHITLNAIAAEKNISTEPSNYQDFEVSIQTVLALCVIISGIIFSVFVKQKKWRPIQLALNVIVLGFWAKSYLSIQLLINWFSNGFFQLSTLIPLILLVLAVVMPFVGKHNYYCNSVCPMGSLQELFDKLPTKKVKFSQSVLKYLNHTREVILVALLILMWVGVGFKLLNYEIFSIFLIQQADFIIIIMAIVFLILSCFIPRPYCRFVCPTGQLLKSSQKL